MRNLRFLEMASSKHTGHHCGSSEGSSLVANWLSLCAFRAHCTESPNGRRAFQERCSTLLIGWCNQPLVFFLCVCIVADRLCASAFLLVHVPRCTMLVLCAGSFSRDRYAWRHLKPSSQRSFGNGKRQAQDKKVPDKSAPSGRELW